MELQTIHGSTELTQKQTMSKFVHDVADMEVRAFTLRKTAEQCIKEMKRKKEELEAKQAHMRTIRDGKRNAYDIAQKEVDGTSFEAYCKKRRTASRIFGHLAIHYFLGGSITGTIFAITLGIFQLDKPNFFVVLIAVMAAIGYFVVFYRLSSSSNRKKYHAHMKDLEKARDDAKQQYNDWEEALKEADQELADAIEQEKQVELMARRLEQDADRITENLKRCYELGVIMPSYRNLVSVVILDDIFTNDKADTMREANLLCDTEIRHAELIGKLDEVVHALKILASAIQSMASILQSINTNVSLISQDIYRMAETQEEIKYAADAIKSSADNADFYIAQRRAGAL